MTNIDRRLGRELSTFFLVDKKFFEPINRYEINNTISYRSCIVKYLDNSWNIIKTGIWYNCHSISHISLPEQGFKIHISATSRNAYKILERVVPILSQTKTTFKVVVDEFMLNFVNSKQNNRGASGKFITIYPINDEQFIELLQLLHTATQDMEGPYILSDKRYDTSKVIFYRYGGIRSRSTVNMFGEKQWVLRSPNGQIIPDQRAPFFQLPPWVEDPFVLPSEEPAMTTVILGQRYKVSQSINFSNAGGVYRGIDQHTGEIVLIKEARPYVGETKREHTSATALLQKEFLLLERLRHTGYTPQPLGFVQEWEHFFLIEEYIEAINLSAYRGMPDVALILQKLSTDNIQRFCERFIQIGRNLMTALQAIHQCGVLVVDVSPSNILINPETLAVYFIDLEGAILVDDPIPAEDTLSTPGFMSPHRKQGGQPTIADDYYALGCGLYSLLLPIQPLFTLNPSAKLAFLERLTQDMGLPLIIQQIILDMLDGRIEESSHLLFQERDVPQVYSTFPKHINNYIDQIESVCGGIDEYILHTATCDRNDRLWPADYRMFNTNPLNLAYGALGILLYLHHRGVAIPDHLIDWVLQQKIDNQTYTPGLFVGSSGIAWGLAELGLLEEAEHIIQQAYQSSLLYAGNDIFYGAAGWGLASLYFYTKTQNNIYLEKACESGNYLIGQANREGKVCQWQAPDGEIYHSFAHGASGIALFLLYLYHYTKQQKYLDYALAGLEYEISQALEEGEAMVWRAKPNSPSLSPYWRFGNAGIGSVLIRFATLLHDDRYAQLAARTANYAAQGFAVLPGQFVGMSGLGEFLIDMYMFTNKSQYLQQAQALAANLALFGIKQPEGLAFPGDGLFRLCNDYGGGSAGIGMFLHRLQKPKGRFLYDFDPHFYPSLDVVTK
ncbi:MAG: class III lanthionine synthetase LanKC [Chloroflexota bacterium]